MRILGAAAIAAATALGAYAAVYTSEPSGSGVAVPVLSTFAVVFVACMAASGLAGRADRRSAAEHARRMQQIRAEGQRALDASVERDRRAGAREARVHRIYVAYVNLYAGMSPGLRMTAQDHRLAAVADAAERNASPAEVREAKRRCRQAGVGQQRAWFGGHR